MLSPDNLHDYQQAMIDRLYEHDNTLVIADMGSGKTAATLTAITELLEAGELSRVLVLAPLRIAASVWADEAARWSHLSDLKITRAVGTADQRLEALISDSDIVTLNYENILWLTGFHKTDKDGNKVWVPGALEDQAGRHNWHKYLGFDGLVFDEVSRMKGAHKSKRYKALKRYLADFRWRVGLTGTPEPNGLLDLYGTAYVCDSGAALGRTFTAYRQSYFRPLDPNGWQWAPLPDAEAQIYEALKPSAYVLDPADYVTRPEPTVRDHVVKMSAEGRATARLLEEKFYAELDGAEIDVANGGVLAGKLQQCAQGFVYAGDDERRKVTRFDRVKLDKCVELVESLDGQPVIIAYKFRADLELLQAQFPGAPNLGSGTSAVKGAAIIDQWNAGQVPILLLHPASAGHGLNLQAGGHHMIWYGLTWSSEEYRQAIARIARQGQIRHVYVHRIVSDHWIDANITAALDGKLATEKSLVIGLLEH